MERETTHTLRPSGDLQAVQAHSHCEQDQVRQLWWVGNRYLARRTISGRVQQEQGALHLRILLEVHELGLCCMATQGMYI
jgi:hypothetical protein